MERRLINYEGHIDRWGGTTKDYKWSNPLEAVAGATHVVTSGFGLDAGVRKVLSGKEQLEDYGTFGRTAENTVGTASKLLRGKFRSALGGFINMPGDVIADTADWAAGVNHKRRATARAVDQTLAV